MIFLGAFVDFDIWGVSAHDIGPGAQEGDLRLELFGKIDVVRIKESDIAALHEGERGVAGAGDAAVFRADDDDSLVAEASRDVRRPVRRAVVHHNQFKMRVCLA